ncbi:hypothetical protein FB451DRAFT_1164064 [Mycena latifolia]|nr:hypothetical protein FB451DRAFT_1164064 [Mycena latifolia]
MVRSAYRMLQAMAFKATNLDRYVGNQFCKKCEAEIGLFGDARMRLRWEDGYRDRGREAQITAVLARGSETEIFQRGNGGCCSRDHRCISKAQGSEEYGAKKGIQSLARLDPESNGRFLLLENLRQTLNGLGLRATSLDGSSTERHARMGWPERNPSGQRHKFKGSTKQKAKAKAASGIAMAGFQVERASSTYAGNRKPHYRV